MRDYVGVVFSTASVIADLTMTATCGPIDIVIVDSGPFPGAVCFLVGAYLLLPPAPTTPRSA